MPDTSATTRITIRHMVCPRCIQVVTKLIRQVGLDPQKVVLGEATVMPSPTSQQWRELDTLFSENGFGIVESESAKIVARIKALIIERTHYSEVEPQLKLSAFLSEQLHSDYSRLSKLFSAVESMTIERFATLQRIEKVKELLVYDEHSVAEIADRLGYSSPAHLTSRFKEETGMTPSQFKKLKAPFRRSLDEI